MEYRRFGNTGLTVSAIGFGGSEIGFSGTSQGDVERLLNTALDAGLTVIDTAECYANSEEKIGVAVSHRRSEFTLFTKCGHASGLKGEDWDPKMLAESIDRSLVRLKTDHVDLVQLHSCSLDVLKSGGVIEVLQRAKEAGKTKLIGYSGDREEARFAVESGLFDALQTSCNIADQDGIDLFLSEAERKGIGVIAKRPVANVAWLRPFDPKAYYHGYAKRLRTLGYDFLTKSPEESFSIALRFTLAQPGISTAIVGTQNPERWLSNAKVTDEPALTDSEIKAIRNRWFECREESWVGEN